MGNLLSDIFDPRSVKPELQNTDREAVFAELIDAMAAVRPEFDRAEILKAMVARENRMSTGIAPGIAVPHAFRKGAEGIVGAIGVSRPGIEFDALDGKPVHAVFMLVIGEKSKGDHLRALNRIFTLAHSEELALIRNAKTPGEILGVLERFG